ncbi:hypothetical protein [Flavobacterium sp. 3-210]
MKVFEISSTSLVFGKRGISTETIDGNGTIFIAFIVLSISFLTYLKLKKDEIEINKRKDNADEEKVLIKKSIRKKKKIIS